MFTNKDYFTYFKTLEDMLREELMLLTDTINELSDQSIRNKLCMVLTEDTEDFRFFRDQAKQFES